MRERREKSRYGPTIGALMRAIACRHDLEAASGDTLAKI
jgi:uncharacterized protein